MEDQTGKNCIHDLPNRFSSNATSIDGHRGEIDRISDQDCSFSSSTPLKTEERSVSKVREELAAPLEKYGELLEFFDDMICSVRLLGLRKGMPTFQKIRRQVEIPTGRKFSSTHLAQMKHLLPEAVQIEKILIHDVETKCMKPDMKIWINLDVVRDHDEVSAFVALRKLFCSGLREFHNAHPDALGVPEAELPYPFNQRMITVKDNLLSNNLRDPGEDMEVSNLRHLPVSFRRRFSAKTFALNMDETDLHVAAVSSFDTHGETDAAGLLSSASTDSVCENTPMKPRTGITNTQAETPMRSTPMRLIPPTQTKVICEDENKKTISEKSQQPTKTAKKSLDFYGIDGEYAGLPSKEISTRSSEFVIIIHQIFQSVGFRPVTNGELVHKIIMNKLDLTDPSEVEMQMERIEKLVPDWLCRHFYPSGDLIYKVKKVSDLNSICEIVDASS